MIRDVDALTYSKHSATVALHGVVVFRNEHGHALRRVREIEVPPLYGTSPGARLEFTCKVRPRLDIVVGEQPKPVVPQRIQPFS